MADFLWQLLGTWDWEGLELGLGLGLGLGLEGEFELEVGGFVELLDLLLLLLPVPPPPLDFSTALASFVDPEAPPLLPPRPPPPPPPRQLGLPSWNGPLPPLSAPRGLTEGTYVGPVAAAEVVTTLELLELSLPTPPPPLEGAPLSWVEAEVGRERGGGG